MTTNDKVAIVKNPSSQLNKNPVKQNIIATPTRYNLKRDCYSSHQQIASWLNRYKAQATPNRSCVIYDIGCAQGMLGQLLSPSDFTLFGVDFNPTVVQLAQAQPIYREVNEADIEDTLTFTFPEPPDVMVLSDILEHTQYSAYCLERLGKTYLPPRTRVIVSLPNIAHLYVRLSLLIGRFEYADRGILDRTHLQFFTLASALAMVESAGFIIDDVAVTPVPLPLVHPIFDEGGLLWPLHQLNAMLTRAFKTLLGYQVIIYGTYNP